MWSDAEGGAWDVALSCTRLAWELLGTDARFEGCSLAFSDGALQAAPLASVVLLCSHMPVSLFGLSPALFSVRAPCWVFLGLFVT